jgi:hypothetical protein
MFQLQLLSASLEQADPVVYEILKKVLEPFAGQSRLLKIGNPNTC